MSATDTTSYEIWTDPMGRPAYLIPIGTPDLSGDEFGDGGWYADFPGQRPPFEYRIQAVHNPNLALREIVTPWDPESAYDCIWYRLHALGFTPPPQEEDGVCEHGLSLSLCAGPGHYPMDM